MVYVKSVRLQYAIHYLILSYKSILFIGLLYVIIKMLSLTGV